jgi:hypothetical protein
LARTATQIHLTTMIWINTAAPMVHQNVSMLDWHCN